MRRGASNGTRDPLVMERSNGAGSNGNALFCLRPHESLSAGGQRHPRALSRTCVCSRTVTSLYSVVFNCGLTCDEGMKGGGPAKLILKAGRGARWARAQTSLLPYKAPPTPYVCAYYHFTVPPGARQNPDVVHAMACTEHAFHAPLRSSHVRHDTRLVRRITTRRGGARASARTRAVFHRPPPMAAPPRPAHLSVRGHFVEQLGAGLEQSGVSLRSQAEACARLRHMPRHLRSWEECAHVLELPGPRLATE